MRARSRSGSSVVEEILAFNAGRDPDRLPLKFAAMRGSPFAFLRGACHLFYSDWPGGKLDQAPLAWLCGDLHLENFGAYKGDNRLTYFDLTDFDEAALAPCTWDVARFLTSVHLAADGLEVPTRDRRLLLAIFLDSYYETLAQGRARWVERATAEGMILDLLVAARRRRRRALLDSRTLRQGSARRLRLDGRRTLPASRAERARVTKLLRSAGRKRRQPEFFRVLDLARRIAGTGSLGVERYTVLVEGRGSPHDNYLLDIKAARPPAAASRLVTPQPQWTSEAKRVVTIQRRMQVTSPALLTAIGTGEAPYVLRELQPREDRLSLMQWNGRLPALIVVLLSQLRTNSPALPNATSLVA